jgi:phosphinothricin acetyltransferase
VSEVTIRTAGDADLPTLTAIYNHYVDRSVATFDTEPFTVEQRRSWFAQFAGTGRHRLLVAEVDTRVVGYAGSHAFRSRAAYDPTVETSIYLDHAERGRGVGRRLYQALFELLSREDIHSAVAGITLPNDPSVGLHRSFGFEPCGVMREVGRKHGRYHDVAWMQRRF